MLCQEYREMLLKCGASASKHQSEVTARMRRSEVLCQNSLQVLQEISHQQRTFQACLQETDAIAECVIQVNSSLKLVVELTQNLCQRLPEDLRPTDPVPLPSFELERNIPVEDLYALAKKNRVLQKEGIGQTNRRLIWQRSIGNRLGITRDHFHKYSDVISVRHNQLKTNSTFSNRELASHFRLIKVDVLRTFPSLEICVDSEGSFSKDLTQILEAYAVFRPAVGYSQGMSFVAAMLLLHMEKYEAFVCFCNLLNSHFFVSLYKMNLPDLLEHIGIFDLLLEDNLPALFQHFHQLQIKPENYLFAWLSTVFAKTLPLAVTCKIWDTFLVEGEVYLYKTAIGILKLYQNKLLKGSFEDCIRELRQIKDITAKSLLESTSSVNVRPLVLEYLQKFDAENINSD